MIKIAPSILSADFSRLGEEIDSVSTADYIHFDVMDGAFVPNISLGLPELVSVRRYTGMTLDVHLMIADPLKYVRRFAEAGADIVVFHVEAASDAEIRAAMADVRALGKKVGLSVKPKTPASALFPYLPELDMALVMTVEPGFGGQKFMEQTYRRLREARKIVGDKVLLQVDGGVNLTNAPLLAEAGADVLVAGSAVFNATDMSEAIRKLKG